MFLLKEILGYGVKFIRRYIYQYIMQVKNKNYNIIIDKLFLELIIICNCDLFLVYKLVFRFVFWGFFNYFKESYRKMF